MIISISGKIGSGKDTVGKIIQYLTSECSIENLPRYRTYDKWLEKQTSNLDFEPHYISDFKIHKFADTLKDIVCLLIGCTREELEDHEFKNKELGEEWTRYGYADGYKRQDGQTTMINKTCDKERYEIELKTNWQTAYKSELTPRLLLQLLGTECGRNIIHPNIWVNSLFSKYKGEIGIPTSESLLYPNWIITDTRFPNELKAIKDRQGISIKVDRWLPISKLGDFIEIELLWGTGETKIITKVNSYKDGRFYNNQAQVILEELVVGYKEISTHESETALDNAEFDYVIDNSGTIEELIESVKEILIKEKILC